MGKPIYVVKHDGRYVRVSLSDALTDDRQLAILENDPVTVLVQAGALLGAHYGVPLVDNERDVQLYRLEERASGSKYEIVPLEEAEKFVLQYESDVGVGDWKTLYAYASNDYDSFFGAELKDATYFDSMDEARKLVSLFRSCLRYRNFQVLGVKEVPQTEIVEVPVTLQAAEGSQP